MKVHEYQAKRLFGQYGVPVPEGNVASTPEEARQIASELKGKVIVKAQIHAGGRGKGGGIKLANDPEEAQKAADEILGMTLVTHQTGAEGRLVQKVLVERASQIEREIYLGIAIDRENCGITIISSSEGGMEIEKVSAENPEKINKTSIDPAIGLMPYQARDICFGLGLSGQAFKEGTKCIMSLYKLFTQEDASLAEINPLIVTSDDHVMALDAKLNFDDNASYRHKEHGELRDHNEETPLETEASRHNLNYIKLSGSVGCMVNGAGLAMATMDLIKMCGSEPANFLDVGGTASSEGVENAFRILISDEDVKCVLINIFGGIVRCDKVAEGMLEALKHIGDIEIPIVVRLEGTNAKEGIEILRDSGLGFHIVTGFQEAAQRAADLSNMGNASPNPGSQAPGEGGV